MYNADRKRCDSRFPLSALIHRLHMVFAIHFPLLTACAFTCLRARVSACGIKRCILSHVCRTGAIARPLVNNELINPWRREGVRCVLAMTRRLMGYTRSVPFCFSWDFWRRLFGDQLVHTRKDLRHTH